MLINRYWAVTSKSLARQTLRVSPLAALSCKSGLVSNRDAPHDWRMALLLSWVKRGSECALVKKNTIETPTGT